MGKPKLVEVGGFGVVGGPCYHWWGVWHRWSRWRDDESAGDGEYVRTCTRPGCGWVEFGADPGVYADQLGKIVRAREERGENERHGKDEINP